MILGYNTNGLACHRPLDGLRLLRQIGYRSVAITVDHHCLDPASPFRNQQLLDIQRFLQDHGMSNVIESGARYLLDSGRKHFPTLLSPGRSQERIDFLKYCLDTAAVLKSDCVSLWSGALPSGVSGSDAFKRLVDNLADVLQHAEQVGIDVGFEPEPGMFIDTMDRFAKLTEQIQSPRFRLTLDVGHLFCMGEVPVADYVKKWGNHLVNVHIEDMKRGVHEHLMFGRGQMEFRPILQALHDAGYRGGLHVELSRHSHDAPSVARASFNFLNDILSEVSPTQSK